MERRCLLLAGLAGWVGRARGRIFRRPGEQGEGEGEEGEEGVRVRVRGEDRVCQLSNLPKKSLVALTVTMKTKTKTKMKMKTSKGVVIE